MNRLRGLDGVRGIAILWVLLYHLFALVPKPPALASVPVLSPVANVGWMGVTLFFALSGYLIVPILVADRGTPGYFGRFAVRRAFRLVPVYLLLLVSFPIAARLWPVAGDEGVRLFGPGIPFWSYVLFVQNIPMALAGFLGNAWLRVTWTLAVEVQFYLLIAIVVFLVPRSRLLPWLVTLALGALAFRATILAVNPAATTAQVVLLPSRLDGFLVGACVALRFPPGIPLSGARQAVAAGVLVISAVVFVLFATGKFGSWTRGMVAVYPLVLAIGGGALLALAGARSALTCWLVENRVVGWTGRLSYFLYLFHMPVLWTVYRGIFDAEPALNTAADLGKMVCVGVVLFGLAEASRRWLETPLIRHSHGYFLRPEKESHSG